MNWDTAGAFALGAGYAVSTLWPTPGLHDWLVPGAIRRTSAEGVALTFDDGPHPERTPGVLDVLDSAGLRATFFVVGEQVRRHPVLVRRIVAAGHELGNHTDRHAWLPGLSTQRIEQQLVQCQRAVEDAAGVTPELVRPPYGHRDVRFYLVARRLGLAPVLWSVDTLDYLGIGAATVARRAGRATAGDIVLFHDGNSRAGGTLGGVTSFARMLRERGLGSAPVATSGPPAASGYAAS